MPLTQFAPVVYRPFLVYRVLPFNSVAQLCPSLCDPMDCSTPGFSILHYFPVTHVPLIIAISAGNQTQVLPQCDHFMSEPAGSAASEERAPYCSGEGLTGQKTLLIP